MPTTSDLPCGRSYLELIDQVPLRPLRTDADLDRAVAMIDALLDRESLGPDEQNYLEVLADLVAKFEAAEHPLPAVTEAEMLRHLIEARGVTQAEVAAVTGIAESTVSAILAGKRSISRGHLTALARFFQVSPAVFLPT